MHSSRILKNNSNFSSWDEAYFTTQALDEFELVLSAGRSVLSVRPRVNGHHPIRLKGLFTNGGEVMKIRVEGSLTIPKLGRPMSCMQDILK